jgi:hypothetical protein
VFVDWIGRLKKFVFEDPVYDEVRFCVRCCRLLVKLFARRPILRAELHAIPGGCSTVAGLIRKACSREKSKMSWCASNN